VLDADRYVLLYLYGGMYMDLDVECRKPLDFLRAYPFVMPQTRPVGFSNDFLVARPGHPFIQKLVQALPRWNVWLLSKYPTVMFSTGPMFVTLQASFYGDRRSLWVLPDRLYGKYVPTDESLFGHLFGSSWHGEDAKSVLWIAHHPTVLLAVCVVSALAGALYIWRRCCMLQRSSSSQSAQETAALKMC
jgi:mannosyltransferase OCH1-like enzyme